MSVAYRPQPAQRYNPEEVRSIYQRGGWRLLERNYGTSSPVIQQLIAIIGGQEAKQERAAVQRTGRKAGGRVLEVAGG